MTADEVLADLATPEPTTGCWLWLGAERNGYGRIRVAGRRVSAHTFVYEQLVGPLEPGTEPDHLCRQRACVNPAHLEPVTHRVNLQRSRGWGARRRVCRRGHLLTPENVILERSATGVKHRCRTCRTADRVRNGHWKAAPMIGAQAGEVGAGPGEGVS